MCMCLCVCASIYFSWAKFFKSMNAWGIMSGRCNRMGLSSHHKGSDIPSIYVSHQNIVGTACVVLRSTHVCSAFPACHLLPLSPHCCPWRERKSLGCDLGLKSKGTAPANSRPMSKSSPSPLPWDWHIDMTQTVMSTWKADHSPIHFFLLK